jgi:hypothetical protein
LHTKSLRSLLLITKINTRGLITEGKYIAVEFGCLCKVAIIIDLTYYTTIQKFDLRVFHHLNRYNYNLQFHTVDAVILNCTIAEYITK